MHKIGLFTELHKELARPKIRTRKENQLFLFGICITGSPTL